MVGLQLVLEYACVTERSLECCHCPKPLLGEVLPFRPPGPSAARKGWNRCLSTLPSSPRCRRSETALGRSAIGRISHACCGRQLFACLVTCSTRTPFSCCGSLHIQFLFSSFITSNIYRLIHIRIDHVHRIIDGISRGHYLGGAFGSQSRCSVRRTVVSKAPRAWISASLGERDFIRSI